MSKPEALRLADELSKSHLNHYVNHAAAAELRRLYVKCEALTADTIEEMRRINEIHHLTAQRDALLEALKEAADALEIASNGGGVDFYQYARKARATIAIAKAAQRESEMAGREYLQLAAKAVE